ncbi:unnamed protein product [Nezara viridula]|uniref:RNA helicase n=1 Tax=Nezara viridula TaxID=85310 RepID=A0A9P0HLG1_NEZVI|nr:unnamed protein product [Nezara viridula]
MSSGYRDDQEDGGWRGSHQSGGRSRGGGRDYTQNSSRSGGGGYTKNKSQDGWSDGEDQGSSEPKWGNKGNKYGGGQASDEWENNETSSRGRGFSRQNRTEDSGNYQRQERTFGSPGDRRGGSRGRGFSFRNNDNEDENNDEWEPDMNKLNIRENSSGKDRGFNRQSRGEDGGYQRQERSSFGGGDGWNDEDSGRGNDGGERRSGRGRGGYRGGGRGGHRESRNDFGDNGDCDDDEGKSRGRGNRYSRNDDGDQSDGRRGRGGRGGGRGGFGNRGDDDRGNKEEGEEEKPRERYIPPEPANDEETVFSSSISSGNNFSKYDNIPVKVTGENVPKPVNSFEECNFSSLLLENIKKSGYSKPTPVQKYAISAINSGRDVMGCAQTGSGKTAAFLLPIIHMLLKDKADIVSGQGTEPQVVVCSPTRELALQIFNEARKFAFGSIIRIAIAYGGTASFHQASQISKGCHILVATPGRLNDFVGRGLVKFSSCRFFVLDEADRMLDMGFLPAIEQMLDHETMTPKGQRQTLMFSATFPDDIQRLAANYLHGYLFLAVGIVGGACSDVEQNFYLVSRFEKKDKLIEVLSEMKDKELTLVFVEKQRTADFIAAFLSENNFPTTSIHGARLQSQREQALSDFKYGRMPTLVATAVAARGLDIKNVAHVVNFDMPSTIEEYVHRIGRTGRVGNRGKATSFYDPDTDGHLVIGLTRILQQNDQVIPTFFEGANDSSPSFKSGGGGRRSQNFGGKDVRQGEDIFNSPPTVVHEEVEEAW